MRSLTELARVGYPIEFIHDGVPGLNAQIGPQIQTFFSKLKPGSASRRTTQGDWMVTQRVMQTTPLSFAA